MDQDTLMFPDLALVGYMGAGKSELRTFLTQECGYIHLSFATPLKNLYVKMVGREIDKRIDRPRLQNLGNGARNSKNAWIGNENIPVTLRALGMHWLIWPGDVTFRYFRAVLNEFFYSGLSKEFGNPNFWVNQLITTYSLLKADTRVVVDDMRYPNEADALRNHGFLIARVNAPLDVIKQRLKARDGGYDDSWFTHPSETQHLNIIADFEVENTKPIEEVIDDLFTQLS